MEWLKRLFSSEEKYKGKTLKLKTVKTWQEAKLTLEEMVFYTSHEGYKLCDLEKHIDKLYEPLRKAGYDGQQLMLYSQTGKLPKVPAAFGNRKQRRKLLKTNKKFKKLIDSNKYLTK